MLLLSFGRYISIATIASSGWQYALVSLPTCNSLTPPDYGGAHQGATSEA